MTVMQAVDGILLVDKPKGLSSNAVLQRAKRLLGAAKAGHTGSLDPLATGMLPVCLGEATKFSQYLLDADKAYDVTGVFGAWSSTGDAEGEIHPVSPDIQVSEEALKQVLQQLTGPIEQVPPMYSALKHKGKPLYTYARRGEVIERPARKVTIYDMNFHKLAAKSFYLSVKCSKGTYIRSLIETIGEQLGVGAYVTELHRTYTAGFEHEPMWRLEDLEAESLEARRAHLLPPERAVIQFPQLDIGEDVKQGLYQGRVISEIELVLPAGLVRLYAPGDGFLGLGEVTAEGYLKAKRLKSSVHV